MNTFSKEYELAVLEAELTATEHKMEQLYKKYIKTAIEKALVDEINKLSDDDKVVLLVKLLDMKSADSNTLNGCSVNDFMSEIRNLMKHGVKL
jgi:hypothetical protein